MLGERIGAGGMGDVYLAERADGRHAAIKVLKRGLDSDALLRRFRLEQETLAALRHAHIVAFLDAGVLADGRPYLVMEHVDGTPLADEARGRDLEGRLALFLDVCAAVVYAHANLVLHRDLKPANVLVARDGRGEAPRLRRGKAARGRRGRRSHRRARPR